MYSNSTKDVKQSYRGHPRKEKDILDVFYSSWKWRRCKDDYLSQKSVGGLCEECRRSGKVKTADEVHHKIRLTKDNVNKAEIALNWANLEALCEDCHKQKHRKTKRWRVDEDGNVTALDPP